MITIREVKTLEKIKEVQKLEETIWGNNPIPTHQTITAIKNGGMIVGAYDGEKLVGLSYGFAGFKDGQVYLCSHMLGIDENYRSQKIGEQLKLAQREIAIEKGYTRMHWTYDPLETRNGYLNLTKLNGICDTYIENCYGEMQDGLNKGLPSDRFEVHWHLTSNYVEQKVEPVIENPISLGIIEWDANQLPSFKPQYNTSFTGNCFILPVPKNFQQLKAQSPQLAMDWRLKVRDACQSLFSAGFVAVRLQKQSQWNEYVFVRKDVLHIA